MIYIWEEKGDENRKKMYYSSELQHLWQSWLLKYLTNLMVFRTWEWTLQWFLKAVFLRKIHLLVQPQYDRKKRGVRCISFYKTINTSLCFKALFPKRVDSFPSFPSILNLLLPKYSRKQMIWLFEELCICQKIKCYY